MREMIVDLKTAFGDWSAVPIFARKPRGLLELSFVGLDGSALLVASIQLASADLDPDEIAIRDYNRNQGIRETLVANGLIDEPHRTAPSGLFDIQIARLTTKALEEAERQLDHDIQPAELDGVELP
jgi:hypothetical protein